MGQGTLLRVMEMLSIVTVDSGMSIFLKAHGIEQYKCICYIAHCYKIR